MDVLILILIGIASRLLPHPANVTAVGSLALFSGAKLGLKKALPITFVVMLFSDIVLGFHAVMWATYLGMFVPVAFGALVGKSRRIPVIGGATLSSSLFFFLITNFAVWAVPGSMYPHTISGLFTSYAMGIPFFRNSLIGDIAYTTIFFVGWELVMALKGRYRDMIRIYDRSA